MRRVVCREERGCARGAIFVNFQRRCLNNNVCVLCLTSYYLLAFRIQHAQPYLHCFTLSAQVLMSQVVLVDNSAKYLLGKHVHTRV